MTKDYDPSPWFPETDPVKLAALGKALEEVFELTPLVTDFPPPRGKTIDAEYWQHLAEELADVQATLLIVADYYKIDVVYTPRIEMASARQALFDLGKALSRVLIQGIDGIEPRTGVSNHETLLLHIHQVLQFIDAFVDNPFNADHKQFIADRTARKRAYLLKWHENMQADLDEAEQDRILDAWGDAFDLDRGD